jgi:hypothetical protein
MAVKMNTVADLSGREREFERWLAPFLEALGHKKQRKWAPIYMRGLSRSGRLQGCRADG